MNDNKDVLIITNYDDYHADLVVKALEEEFSIGVVRWHPDELLCDFDISLEYQRFRVSIPSSGKSFSNESIRSVWYRRPRSPKSQCTESQAKSFSEKEAGAVVQTIYRLLSVPWYSHPSAILAGQLKLTQPAVAERVGFRIPEFLVSSSIADVEQFYRSHADVIIKAICANNSIVSGEELAAPLRAKALGELEIEILKERGLSAPVFVQELIEKIADLRVTVIGSDVFAVSITSRDMSVVDTRSQWEDALYEIVDLDQTMKNGMLNWLREYGLNYGAFDFAIDEKGTPWFLECNPSGQFAWIDEKVNTQMVKCMARHLALLDQPLV